MTIDLEAKAQIASAKVAVAIEKAAGPTDPENQASVAEHKEKLAQLEEEAMIAVLKYQDQCEHYLPGLTFISPMPANCEKCESTFWGVSMMGGRVEPMRNLHGVFRGLDKMKEDGLV